MKVFFAENSDEFGYGLEESGYDVLFISYRIGYYDGDGYALGLKNGKVYAGGLGHCSCYGPEDRILDMDEIDFSDESVLGELAALEQDEFGREVLEMYRKYMEQV